MNSPASPKLTSIDDALKLLLKTVPRIQQTESVVLLRGVGRVLAESCASGLQVPPWDNSAMDGYALNVADFSIQANPDAQFDISQRIPAGKVGKPLQKGTVARIFTGAPIPDGADAVVMQENCEAFSVADTDKIRVMKMPNISENIRVAGDDIQQGSELFCAGHRLTPQDLGALASVGIEQVLATRPLKVALVTTGDELVAPGTELAPGQIYNSNFFTIAGLLAQLGVDVIDVGIAKDSAEETQALLLAAAQQADCVITTGGVSVGEEDHVKAVVEATGQLNLWKLAIKPGKPLAWGEIAGTQFFGLPGNPVSAFVTFVMVVRPALLTMLGCTKVNPLSYPLKTGFDLKQTGVRQEYLRVGLAVDETGQTVLNLFNNQSSGVNSSLSWAQGLAVVPPYTAVGNSDMLHFIPFSELCY